MSLFEKLLSVPIEILEFEFKGHNHLPWPSHWLNPRRLRGSDFLMRWSQGAWSEERFVQAINETPSYFALPYGPSGTAPDDDVREFELYFERLEAAGLGTIKRPDLLIFKKQDEVTIKKTVLRLGDVQELPFTREDHPDMQLLLSKAIIAIECENSLWVAAKMPQYGENLKPQRRLKGQLGLPKNAVLPTIIIKDQDRLPLSDWQAQNNKKIHIWHGFYDMSFGIEFDEIQNLITTGKIEPTKQIFQAPGGATSTKIIYKIYYHYAYPLGKATTEPKLVAASITDKNGHILPYVKFEGGNLNISQETVQILDRLSGKE